MFYFVRCLHLIYKSKMTSFRKKISVNKHLMKKTQSVVFSFNKITGKRNFLLRKKRNMSSWLCNVSSIHNPTFLSLLFLTSFFCDIIYRFFFILKITQQRFYCSIIKNTLTIQLDVLTSFQILVFS